VTGYGEKRVSFKFGLREELAIFFFFTGFSPEAGADAHQRTGIMVCFQDQGYSTKGQGTAIGTYVCPMGICI
jgi:hypothetical protein